MRTDEAIVSTISKGTGFLKRQQNDWKVTVGRTSIDRFLYQMVFPYLSIYIVGLGATATRLGMINSIGMGITGLLCPFNGWLMDRIGVKKIYLAGIILLVMAYLTYGLAQSWPIIIFAMIAYQAGATTSIHSCGVVCGKSLANNDRATAMAFCESIAAGLLGIAGPMLGAFLVATLGGVNVSGIRPLFFIAFAGSLATFFLILMKLSNSKGDFPDETRHNLLEGIARIFKRRKNLRRWVAINSLNYLPYGMVLPFTQVFAHEVKGADQYVLGAMVSGFALTSLVLGVPLGRLADKIGRKKVLYLIAPIFWASNLMLVWAPSPGFLIAAGTLQGIYWLSLPIAGAMSFELVPAKQMGAWLGTLGLFRMLIAASAAYLGGAIWDGIGPQYIFLTIIAADALIRIPLLIGMPETLRSRLRTGWEE
ncbi:MFS transporter [Chloroflexota bacterium]